MFRNYKYELLNSAITQAKNSRNEQRKNVTEKIIVANNEGFTIDELINYFNLKRKNHFHSLTHPISWYLFRCIFP